MYYFLVCKLFISYRLLYWTKSSLYYCFVNIIWLDNVSLLVMLTIWINKYATRWGSPFNGLPHLVATIHREWSRSRRKKEKINKDANLLTKNLLFYTSTRDYKPGTQCSPSPRQWFYVLQPLTHRCIPWDTRDRWWSGWRRQAGGRLRGSDRGTPCSHHGCRPESCRSTLSRTTHSCLHQCCVGRYSDLSATVWLASVPHLDVLKLFSIFYSRFGKFVWQPKCMSVNVIL